MIISCCAVYLSEVHFVNWISKLESHCTSRASPASGGLAVPTPPTTLKFFPSPSVHLPLTSYLKVRRPTYQHPAPAAKCSATATLQCNLVPWLPPRLSKYFI